MNDTIINGAIFVVIVIAAFAMLTRDKSAWRRLPRPGTKVLEHWQENDVDMGGNPRAGCREAWLVQANSRTVSELRAGMTIQGDRSKVATRVPSLGPHRWIISSEKWHTEPPRRPAGMSAEKYVETLRRNGWTVRDA
jgi:hypothetical protein